MDAGHGGHDAGATWRGIEEKDIVQAHAALLAGAIRERGGYVVLTRAGDEAVAPAYRKGAPGVLLSLHADAHADTAIGGPTVHAPSSSCAGDAARAKASQALAEAVAGELGAKVYQACFPLLRDARVPAVVVMLGYLSNPADAERLQDEGQRQEMATALARAAVRPMD